MGIFRAPKPKTIIFGFKKIPITLRTRKGAKGIRISISSHDSAVTVTYARFVPLIFVKKYLETKTVWIEEKLEKLDRINPILRVKYTKKEIKEYSIEALALVKSRLEYFNQYYNLEYKRVSIKNQNTKWGSCSNAKNLNFNYKIILLPKDMQDYLVVHELCHLKEFNHSKSFWDLVGEKIPNYKELSKSLKVGDFN
jgi:predicted metal-dependent hydrolase